MILLAVSYEVTRMSSESQPEIYHGLRDSSFKTLIISLLKLGKLSDSTIEQITKEDNLKLFSRAFTASCADEINNYEMYEQLGDVTANKFIVWYCYRRFPQLKHPLGVKVVARLRINYGARQSFFKIGEMLGFWNYITASEETRGRKKKDLLEDCVESFCGVTEFLIDEIYNRPGMGNIVVYDILTSIFDRMPMSLKYEDLYDSKTRLKELFDFHKDVLGKLKYTNTRNPESGLFTASAKIISESSKTLETIGTGVASKLKDAEQKAAEQGIYFMKHRYNLTKSVPKEYELFNN